MNDSSHRPHRSFVAIALALGFALRLTGLSVHSLWFDECMTVFVAKSDSVIGTLAQDRHPPLCFLAFRAWIAAFGDSETALRLLPALVSCATLLVFARAASILAQPTTALLAVALMAVSPFSIWYGQEVRAYFLLEFFASLTLLGLALALRDRRPSAWPSACIAAGTCGALGSHYMGALLVPVVIGCTSAAWLSHHMTTRRAIALVSAACVGAASWLPWLATMTRTQMANSWGYTARLTPRDIAELPARLFLVEADVLPTNLRFLGYAAGALILASLGALAIRAIVRRDRASVTVVLAFAIPIVSALLLATIAPPNFAPRYLITAEPAAVLAVAMAMTMASSRALRATAAACLLLPLLLVSVLHKQGNLKEDFRTACHELAARFQTGDAITCVTGTMPGFAESPLTYYLRDRPELLAAIRPERDIVQDISGMSTGARLHVIHRESGYSEATFRAIADRTTPVFEGATRARVQYSVRAVAR